MLHYLRKSLTIFSSGSVQDFQLLQSDDHILRRGPPLENGYIGVNNFYAEGYDYSSPSDPKDYADAATK